MLNKVIAPILFLFFTVNAVCSSDVEEAGILAGQGDYREAYERLIIVVAEMQAEIKNLEGLVQYYKNEPAGSDNPHEIVDYSYNEAANRLWASAWNLQHDAVFKKTGKEKEEYLRRAIDTYKRIIIDYPYSNKAEEARYRIGRIYYKFIKDYKLAESELQKYADMYPKGRFTSEAGELLGRIRRE